MYFKKKAQPLNPWQNCCLVAAITLAPAAVFAQPTTLAPVKVTAQTSSAATSYKAERTTTATRTDTPLIDVPQAISVIPRAVIEDQAMTSLADVVKYTPGVSMVQGEGNRDQAVFRGIGSTGDFFVNGLRDDIPYYRDLYNIERVEVLKGPNAMIFGRGGSGGVLNRVTRQAQWAKIGEVNFRLGSEGEQRASVDVGRALSDTAAFRITGVTEDSESYRDYFKLKRYGVNPTLAFKTGNNTLVRIGYEHFKDERTADRGIPSFQGRPVNVDPEQFFGNPELSRTWARVDALTATIEHDFGNGLTVKNNTRWADYAKFYQNVFPGAVDTTGTMVSLAAYNSRSDRTNFFNQTDFNYKFSAGGLKHNLMFGAEFGEQRTDNYRNSGKFPGGSLSLPLSASVSYVPVTFYNNGTSDANSHTKTEVAAFYVQDQLEFSPQWQAIFGLRYDRFKNTLDNHNNGSQLSHSDDLVSPRIGLIYKPLTNVSLYASHTVAYQPRSGDQLGSLSATNANLDPEKFRNFEVGAKWDINRDLSASAALYRLQRTKVAVTDPSDPTGMTMLLVDGQTAKGLELSLSGRIVSSWWLTGSYAYQTGEYDSTQSATIQNGARLAQLPRHTFSLWNRYDFNDQWGAGLGVISQSDLFTSADGKVTLPGYARIDAALYYSLTPAIRVQANLENLFDRKYYAAAHSNNNITPGAPRALRLSLNVRF